MYTYVFKYLCHTKRCTKKAVNKCCVEMGFGLVKIFGIFLSFSSTPWTKSEKIKHEIWFGLVFTCLIGGKRETRQEIWFGLHFWYFCLSFFTGLGRTRKNKSRQPMLAHAWWVALVHHSWLVNPPGGGLLNLVKPWFCWLQEVGGGGTARPPPVPRVSPVSGFTGRGRRDRLCMVEGGARLTLLCCRPRAGTGPNRAL